MGYKTKKEHKNWLKKYKNKHPEKLRETSRKYAFRLRSEVIEKYGGKCVGCGFSDLRALQIDHVDGGGTQERKKMSNKMLLHKLKREPINKKYQILCANCNAIKRITNGENQVFKR